MAKGKHAAALFEVIQSQKKYERSAGSRRGILRTPKWWFNARRRLKAMASATSSSDAGLAGMTPAFAGSSSSGSSGSDRLAEASLPYAGASTATGIKGSLFAFRMDSDRQEISVRISYTTGLVAMFSLMVLVGLAYVAGRNTRPSPMPMLSSLATEQIKQLPPQRSVLDLSGNGAAALSRNVEGEPNDDDDPAPSAAASLIAAAPKLAPSFNDPRPPATVVVEDKKRNIGLNYVVIQSYPDEKMAQDAVEILGKNGVPATIERGLKGWSSNLHMVVGTHGFNRISSAEYRAYLKKIEEISNQYAGKKSFKSFQPIAKKWDTEG